MENCPSCKHEFKSIEDFPRVKVLKVERGDLEELVGNLSRRHGSTNPLAEAFHFGQHLTAGEWMLLQKAESVFLNPENVKKDRLGEYFTVGNNFDYLIEQALASDPPRSQQEKEELAKIIAESREGRLYREPVMEEQRTIFDDVPYYSPPPPNHAPSGAPTILNNSLPPMPSQIRVEPSQPKQIGWRYFFTNSPDKLMAQVTAYVGRLESLVGTVVEPKELLGLDMRPLVFAEVADVRYEPVKAIDGTEILQLDGTAYQFPVKIADHKSPRETGIHFGEYGGRRIGVVPISSPIVTITYEGMLTEQQEPSTFTPRPTGDKRISSHD